MVETVDFETCRTTGHVWLFSLSLPLYLFYPSSNLQPNFFFFALRIFELKFWVWTFSKFPPCSFLFNNSKVVNQKPTRFRISSSVSSNVSSWRRVKTKKKHSEQQLTTSLGISDHVSRKRKQKITPLFFLNFISCLRN